MSELLTPSKLFELILVLACGIYGCIGLATTVLSGCRTDLDSSRLAGKAVRAIPKAVSSTLLSLTTPAKDFKAKWKQQSLDQWSSQHEANAHTLSPPSSPREAPDLPTERRGLLRLLFGAGKREALPKSALARLVREGTPSGKKEMV